LLALVLGRDRLWRNCIDNYWQLSTGVDLDAEGRRFDPGPGHSFQARGRAAFTNPPPMINRWISLVPS
jgi:hypothetical protein